MLNDLRAMILRDLESMKNEVDAYDEPADLWAPPKGITNSAGNLALHAAGNLRHFIGHVLGGSGYERDRDAEFESKNVPVEDVLGYLTAAEEEVDRALRQLDPAILDQPYPLDSIPLTTSQFLLHLSAHLAYHVGQVDYHRRLVSGKNQPVDNVTFDGILSRL